MYAQNADVAITQTGPTALIQGTTAAYIITLTNNGPSIAKNATWKGNVVAGLATFNSLSQISGPADFTCTTPPSGGTGQIQCSEASMTNDESASWTLVLNITNLIPNLPN